MSFIHKYDADGKTLYLISDKASKPSGTFSVKQEYWRGRAVGRYNTVLGQINNLKWTKQEKEVEEPEEAAPKGKQSLSETIRLFASKMKD